MRKLAFLMCAAALVTAGCGGGGGDDDDFLSRDVEVAIGWEGFNDVDLVVTREAGAISSPDACDWEICEWGEVSADDEGSNGGFNVEAMQWTAFSEEEPYYVYADNLEDDPVDVAVAVDFDDDGDTDYEDEITVPADSFVRLAIIRTDDVTRVVSVDRVGPSRNKAKSTRSVPPSNAPVTKQQLIDTLKAHF